MQSHDVELVIDDTRPREEPEEEGTPTSVRWGSTTVEEAGDCGGQLGHYMCGIFSAYMACPILLGLFFSNYSMLSAKLVTISVTLFVAMCASIPLYRDEIVNGFPSVFVISDRVFAITAVFTPFVFIHSVLPDNQVYAYVMFATSLVAFIGKHAYNRWTVTPSSYTQRSLHVMFRLTVGIFISSVACGDSASLYALAVQSLLVSIIKFGQFFYESYHYSSWDNLQPSREFDVMYLAGILRSFFSVGVWISLCVFILYDEVTL